MEDLVLVEEALLFGDEEAKSIAARVLIRLTSKQRHKLADKGVIPALVSMLHTDHQDYESIESTLFALLSLAFGSERNKIRIANSGAIPLLLSVIQCQIHPLSDHAVAALLILSSCATNKPTIAASGAIEILKGSLNENDSSQVKLDIIVTLHNLSTCHTIVPAIVSSGAVLSLIQLINTYDKSSELVEKAIALLDNIVSSSDVALGEAALMEGGIQALVETVEEGSQHSKEHAVDILLLICRSSREKYREMILREGVIPGLLQLSIDGTCRAKGAAKSLLLLLREFPSSCRSERSKNVLLEQVMGQIDRGDKAGTDLSMLEEMLARLAP